MAGKELPAPQDDYDRAILGDIRRVGWSVIQIEPDGGDYSGPAYSFSVGLLHTHGHPEIILLGLPHAVAGRIVNDIGDAVAAGQRIEPGRAYDDFANVPLAFVPVDPAHYPEYVGYALWLYGGPHFPMLQCVWPLKSGHFPWDEGYDPAGAAFQPLLGRADFPPRRGGSPGEDWPFADPENVATMTVRQITQGGQPILLVSRDAEDGTWQFLTGGPVETADAVLVSLREVYRIDPSVAELADLPLGWQAWRSSAGEPWQRQADG
jgi:hypothetical protein